MLIKENYSLKRLNTFGINAEAKKFIVFETEKYLKDYLLKENFDAKNSIILGGGSNILFTKNFDGIVFHSKIKGIKEYKKDSEFVYLEIGSGVIWNDLVSYCVEREYGGIENLTLIPGTVGAAPIQNIGAYGVEFENVFVELDGVDLINGETKTFCKKDCNFGYRDSIFKQKYKNSFFITKVRIKLQLTPKLKTSYRAIQDYIKANRVSNINIKKLSSIIKEIRESKLPDPNKIGNAGSFFKNPIVDNNLFEKLKSEYKDLVAFKISENEIKIPAGWLIEKSGFKGKRIGNVGVHKNQALVLVNYGNGKGSEIINLSEEIKSKIFKKFNISLEEEINIV